MPLTPGARLGRYEIAEPLGKGGMGEVYRAHDSRLGRDVAIKVLPDRLRNHPELRLRLEQEARAISQLKHPHLCMLHDLDHHEDVDFLVMELLEGETLQDRLRHGPIPVAEALDLATKVAEGLDRAHRRGIVHRDLKPGNIMLTADGPKVLDFGLAKDVRKGALTVDTGSPTALVTSSGNIVGTLHYMAPEQLEGREVDTRADVFSFGCVVYEMLTGDRAFDGQSQASVIAAMLERSPPSLAEVEGLSPLRAEAIERCMAKDPERRWQSLADVAILLRDLNGADEPTRSATVEPVPRTSTLLPLLGAVLLALVLGLWIGRRFLSSAPIADERPVRAVVLERSRPGGIEQITNPAVSNDGQMVLFIGQTPQGGSLFLRHLDALDPESLPGLSNAGWARFSADDEWIVYWDGIERTINRVPIRGGQHEVLADPGYLPFDLEPDGTLYYVPTRRVQRRETHSAGIARLSPKGTPELLTEPDVDSAGSPEAHGAPTLLPGGELLLHSRGRGFLQSGWTTGVLDLRSGTWTELLTGVNQATVAGRYLVFWRGSQLWAAPFDLEGTEVLESPRPVVDGVAQHPGAPYEVGQYHLAAEGSLAYIRDSTEASEVGRLLFSRAGSTANDEPEEILTVDGGGIYGLALSPDVRRVAVTRCQGGTARGASRARSSDCGIWIRGMEGGDWVRASAVGMDAAAPVWDPDGRALVFADRTAPEAPRVVRQPIDSSAHETLLVAEPGELPIPAGVDSRKRVVVAIYSPDRTRVRNLILGTEGQIDRRLDGPTDLAASDLSADGRWLLLESFRSIPQIYLWDLKDPTAEPMRLTSDGGTFPAFSSDEGSVYFRTPSYPEAAQIVTATIDKGASRLGLIESVVATRNVSSSAWRDLGRIEGGQDGVFHFAVESTGLGNELILVENWIDTLDAIFDEE